MPGGLERRLGPHLRRAYAAQIFRHPDVHHAWCELAVENRFAGGGEEVRGFLVRHQGMGVYLYGELAASPSRPLQKLVRYYQTNKETNTNDFFLNGTVSRDGSGLG